MPHRLQVSLFSKTIYDVNLDEREMKITDHDALVVGVKDDQEPNSYGAVIGNDQGEDAAIFLKSIRNDIDEFSGNFYVFPRNGMGISDIQKQIETCGIVEHLRREPAEQQIERVTNDDGYTSLNLVIQPPLELNAKNIYVTQVRYQVPLVGQGKSFLFTGAVQPSDYDKLSSLFNIVEAIKYTEIHLWSTDNPYRYKIYDPEEPVYFDSLKPVMGGIARYRDENGFLTLNSTAESTGVMKFERQFYHDIRAEKRARYFTVYAEPE